MSGLDGIGLLYRWNECAIDGMDELNRMGYSRWNRYS